MLAALAKGQFATHPGLDEDYVDFLKQLNPSYVPPNTVGTVSNIDKHIVIGLGINTDMAHPHWHKQKHDHTHRQQHRHTHRHGHSYRRKFEKARATVQVAVRTLDVWLATFVC